MTPEVERLFAEACALPAAQRTAYLRGQTSDALVLQEVRSLLAHDHGDETFFSDAFSSAALSIQSDLDLHAGAKIGVFTVVRMLGRGGMGAVYYATRSDGKFDHAVAIKVIHASAPTAFLLDRFQQERQILASLNHPNIARLLDGGETPAGLPYFVMEYVDGQQIDLYCEQRGLDLDARLRLFLQVAAAVQHAHEHLIIHRDLKPANILVGEDGTPKLLDFGIAKVLDPLSGPVATGSTGVMTPEHASPEQIRGDGITTASDVYSLGSVLYKLLTGKTPHPVQDLAPLDAARMISDQSAQLATGVPQDVAALLAKALHTDPARRYRSASDLSGDIRRYLDGLPVLAASDSLAYRTTKFLRRNWIPATAVAAVVLALTVGTVVALTQARRAERRFAEVRQLANKFLFEFEGSIHNLAGATKARQLVVKTAQEYLDRLAAESNGDPELIRELAAAYLKLGDVQGNFSGANTGDTKAALSSYRKSLQLRDSVGDERATNPSIRTDYVTALSSLASIEDQEGNPPRATELATKAVTVSAPWLSEASAPKELLAAVAAAYNRFADIQKHIGKFPEGVSSANQSLALYQRAAQLDPSSRDAQSAVAVSYCRLGLAQKAAAARSESVRSFQKSVELLEPLTIPTDIANRRELLFCTGQLAIATKDLLVKQKKDYSPVLVPLERAWLKGRELLRDDPGNALVASDVASMTVTYGAYLQQLKQPRKALLVLQPAIETETQYLVRSPGDRTRTYVLGLLRIWAADSHRDLHEFHLALKERRAAAESFSALVDANPNNYAYKYQQSSNLFSTGELFEAMGDFASADDSYHEALRMAEKLPTVNAKADPSVLLKELPDAIRNLAVKRGKHNPACGAGTLLNASCKGR